MNRNVRSRIYLLVLMFALFAVWQYRENQRKEVTVSGITMGVIPYNIKYLDKKNRNFKRQIDSLLNDFNQTLSTYVPDSDISRFNQSGEVDFSFPYFYDVLVASREVYEVSEGAFDPTIGPLIDAWGFGDGETIDLDSAKVDSLRELIGFEKLDFTAQKLVSQVPSIKLNFSAIAKGQAIDVVAEWLLQSGLPNFMVEIGGEVRANGNNLEGDLWTIGIEKPDEMRIGGLFDALYLENRGMATSGNYRNFRVLEDGQKVAHTIDPRTGFPKMQTLLSATVLAPNTMLADGYATACMVLGLEESQELIENNPSLDAYFIYANEEGELMTYVSEGLQSKVLSNL